MGRLRNKIAKFFRGRTESFVESLEDLPPSTTTSQRSYDTEHPAFFLPDEHILIPPFSLTAYLDLYLTDSLSKSLIDSDTNLTVSPLECVSESDDLCKYIDEFHRRIDLEPMVWQLCRDASLFGFGLCEIVGNGRTLLDSTSILGLKRLDPRFILIQKDQRGHFKFFRQRPGLLQGSLSTANFQSRLGYPLSYDTPLAPESIIFVQNWSPLTSYGHSMLQSLKGRLQQRANLIDAAVMAARNHASPVIHIHYQAPEELSTDKKEIDKQRKSLRQQCVKVDKGDSRWLVTGGNGIFNSQAIGHSTVPDLTPLIDRLTAECIIAAGHSPSSLGFTLGTRGVNTFESAGRQTINTILTKQRNLTTQLQNKLYRILPLIEPECPDGEIVVKMQEPTSESMKERLEAEAIQINSIVLMGKAGLISGEDAARKLGFQSLTDEQKWDKMTEPVMDRVNPNDPNQQQQTRAAVNATGKGNNPAGN